MRRAVFVARGRVPGALGEPLFEARIIGALGVSGDSSCADHNVAWRTRTALGLDKVPGGVGPIDKDGINYDLDANGMSAGSFGHPRCGAPGSPGKEDEIAVKIGAGGPGDGTP